MKRSLLLTCFALGILFSCQPAEKESEEQVEEEKAPKVRLIYDTDANNELDDQFALMYILVNGPTFDLEGVTVNATKSGGNIDGHYEEAKRILQLGQRYGEIPLLKGADGSFENIKPTIQEPEYDGKAAVDFIIEHANKSGEELILLAVGKLTNVALALEQDPSIAEKMRVVWLGSNYPKPGEYNQDNDTVSMNYVLNTKVPFEMVTVRYGEPSGTDAVKVTQQEINETLPGMGPKIDQAIEGRHGGDYYTFGDYAVSLFEHIDYHGDSKSRALFDMVAAAILKNPNWGEKSEIPAPILIDNQWVERPENTRKMILWENFDQDAVVKDFYETLENFKLVEPKNP
ncbi:putative inosine-uridine preferring nucleoside hydrolase [Indibacter alkaliphilus LW1]|uniref:Inosine-uridine preferring nucleoside hydrolase n=1 Tax=Indibacter alkaliphilus (strain CCUG 57479 / KCTC 22604 / LW1) TaxID=1189612 RepID=S2D4I7_INDAL|nr:nucleoside hydrolase [Indibacter alkaliphilus]EOZ91965.1 putative inosine-uridine preferring nucleoside hydrolase [Indibacter alkaliphilus LW1]